jgi:hypothetical protein
VRNKDVELKPKALSVSMIFFLFIKWNLLVYMLYLCHIIFPLDQLLNTSSLYLMLFFQQITTHDVTYPFSTKSVNSLGGEQIFNSGSG